MEELAQYAPDLFIIYTGQNEFLERRTYQGLSDSSSLLTGPLSLVFRTRTATVVRNVLDLAGVRPTRLDGARRLHLETCRETWGETWGHSM